MGVVERTDRIASEILLHIDCLIYLVDLVHEQLSVLQSHYVISASIHFFNTKCLDSWYEVLVVI